MGSESGSGVLTQKDTITASSAPVSITVNAANTYLYVASGTSSATLTAYSLSSGAIGSVAAQTPLIVPGYSSDSIVPTGVTVLANNNAVYVTAYDQSAYNPGGTTTSTANPGWVFGYTVGSSGALAAVSGSPWKAGVKPTAIAADPTDRFVYVTDYASNELIGYTIQSGSILNFLTNGPFKTGNEPTPQTPSRSPLWWTRRWAGLSIPPTTWAIRSPASAWTRITDHCPPPRLRLTLRAPSPLR